MVDAPTGSAEKKSGGWGVFVLSFVAAVVVGAAGGYVAGVISGGNGSAAAGATDAESAVDSAPGDEPGVGAEGGADGASDNPYAGFRVGAFDLLDQDGEPVDETIFEGEVTVLTFFFTSCNGPCPGIARVMKTIQDRTREPVMQPTGRDVVVKRLRLASISVDGARDTPEVISSFAESYGAIPSRWRFLTGDPERVRGLVRESIGFELREQEETQVADPSGAMMNNILHPTRLLLVGPDRRLIGVYPFNDPDAVAELVQDAMSAMR